MTDSERNILDAVAAVLKEREANGEAAESVFRIPRPVMRLSMAPPDLAPVAAAIDRMTETVSQALARVAESQRQLWDAIDKALAARDARIAELIEAAAKQLPPEVRFEPVIKLPEPAKPAAKKPRTFTIEHDDGTKSTVTEK